MKIEQRPRIRTTHATVWFAGNVDELLLSSFLLFIPCINGRTMTAFLFADGGWFGGAWVEDIF